MNAQCRRCMRRREVTHAIRQQQGGTYRRAPVWRWTTICQGCVDDLAQRITPGHGSVDRYSVSTIRYLATPAVE